MFTTNEPGGLVLVTETWVACPKCSRAAIVARDNHRFFGNAVITCPHCGYSHSNEHDGDLFGAKLHVDAKGYCPQCYFRGEYSTRLEGYPKSGEIAVNCPECGSGHRANIVATHPVLIESTDPTDPIFQLPLFLQAKCCGRVLYAYNPKNIDKIEAIVLKKHDRDHCQWLPKWVLLAKNRDSVLSALSSLRSMLA